MNLESLPHIALARGSCLQATILILLHLWFTQGTHFRGAQFWWGPGPDPDDPYLVNIGFRIAWRRSYSGSTLCDEETIRDGKLLGPATAGYIVCVGGCDENSRAVQVTNLQFICTDFSEAEDWTAGVRNVTYQFNPQTIKPERYTLRYAGKGWLNGAKHAQDAEWELRMIVDLTVRADTGRVNSSPRASMSTVIRVQQGCSHVLNLPVSDADNDVVICRWATEKLDECGGICNAVHGIDIDEETCTLMYNATEELGHYAVALQLEDYAPEQKPGVHLNTPYSSVPVQFILLVYYSESQCDEKPSFLPPTPEDESCQAIKLFSTHLMPLVARTKDTFTEIIEFPTASVLGMHKTAISLMYDKEDPRDYHVNITWVPNAPGEQSFCFSAQDSRGNSADQRCMYLVVGAVPPEATSVELHREDEEEHLMVVIMFDRQIKRADSERLLLVLDANGDIVLDLDTRDDTLVKLIDKSLQFYLPDRITSTPSTYSIAMQKGAVQGLQRCGAESREFKSEDDLTFIIRGEGTTNGNGGGVATTQSAEPSTDEEEDDEDFLWLILIILGVVILVVLLILLIALVRHRYKRGRDREPPPVPKETNHEQFVRHLRQMGIENSGYEQDFSNINVKFTGGLR